jgi:hypothetical protein
MEAIWRKVRQRHALHIAATDFINVILDARRNAKAFVTQHNRWKQERKWIEQHYKNATEKLWSSSLIIGNCKWASRYRG